MVMIRCVSLPRLSLAVVLSCSLVCGVGEASRWKQWLRRPAVPLLLTVASLSLGLIARPHLDAWVDGGAAMSVDDLAAATARVATQSPFGAGGGTATHALLEPAGSGDGSVKVWLSNEHVARRGQIAGAKRQFVRKNSADSAGEWALAPEFVGSSELADIAVFRSDAQLDATRPALLLSPNAWRPIGSEVTIYGYPMGFPSLNREEISGHFPDMWTALGLSQNGFSGASWADLSTGHLVALHYASSTGTAYGDQINHARSASVVHHVVSRILQQGENLDAMNYLRHPYPGFDVEALRGPPLAQALRAIEQLQTRDPSIVLPARAERITASYSGVSPLRPGDVLLGLKTAVDQTAFRRAEAGELTLAQMIGLPGDSWSIRVLRGADVLDFELTDLVPEAELAQSEFRRLTALEVAPVVLQTPTRTKIGGVAEGLILSPQATSPLGGTTLDDPVIGIELAQPRGQRWVFDHRVTPSVSALFREIASSPPGYILSAFFTVDAGGNQLRVPIELVAGNQITAALRGTHLRN